LAASAEHRSDSDDNSANLGARAYGLYVLAEVGDEALSPLRYLTDNQLDQLPTALAKAQVGAALALHGDRTRAADAFKAALASLGRETGTGGWYRDYGGGRRGGAPTVAPAPGNKGPRGGPAGARGRGGAPPPPAPARPLPR